MKLKSKITRRWRRLLAAAASLVLLLLALFLWNGIEDSWMIPESGVTSHSAVEPGEHLTIMAWNLAKCDFHQGGLDFKSTDAVRDRLDEIAEVVHSENVDLLFVSEVVLEAAPCLVNQVEYLAEQAGFHAWCYGDNYSFGLPFVRIRSGNAILSRFPLTADRVEQLRGETSVWNPTGARRVLWAEVELGGKSLACASIRNDSIDLENNAAQTADILAELGPEPVLIAGDFNAEPGDEPMELWRESGRFRGVFDGPATYPAKAPYRRIDTVLVPQTWPAGATSRVLDVDLSDHEPVVVKTAWN